MSPRGRDSTHTPIRDENRMINHIIWMDHGWAPAVGLRAHLGVAASSSSVTLRLLFCLGLSARYLE